MTRATGQLERSLASLTIGVQTGLRKRSQALGEATGEYDQQIRKALTGHAALAWSWDDASVGFRMPFLSALSQRAAPFVEPHFGYGIVFEQPPPKLVIITPSVVSWSTSPRGWVVGALLRFAAQCPEAASDETVPFSAVAHLTFQGYSAYPETAEELT